MILNGSQQIDVPREIVWTALNDPDVLRQCIPGCTGLERVSDTEMTAQTTLKVGPMKISFSGKVHFSDIDPPSGYSISGEGSGGVAGFARGGAIVKLEPIEEGTILHYEAKSEIGGKLAQLGARLIDSTAKKYTREFFEKFGAIVNERYKCCGEPPQVQAKADSIGVPE
jgi:carbon monoxide dehydrogenase subunit G